MDTREKVARAISLWPCHLDGFSPSIYSDAARQKWRERAYEHADEILALIGHDSDCATYQCPECGIIGGHDSVCAEDQD